MGWVLAWTALLGVLVAVLLYGVLRTLGVPWFHAGPIAALTFVYPWSDSIRLWGSANPPPLSIALAWPASGLPFGRFGAAPGACT